METKDIILTIVILLCCFPVGVYLRAKVCSHSETTIVDDLKSLIQTVRGWRGITRQ